MISRRQLVDWFTTPARTAQSSRNRRTRRSIAVEALEIRTSLSYLPVAAPAHGASLLDRGAVPAVAAQVQMVSTHGSGTLTPDGSGMVGPKDPGGVEL